MNVVQVLVLIAVYSTSHAATCPGSDCPKGDKTLVMLQRAVKESKSQVKDDEDFEDHQSPELQQLQEQVTTLSGTEAHKLDQRIHRVRNGQTDGNITHWIVWFDDSAGDVAIHGACEEILKETGHKCVHEGHPDEKGLPFLDFEGTDQDLKHLMDKYQTVIKLAEPDATFTVQDA